MVWIGGISYSLYLWHWPLIVIGQEWFGLAGPGWGALLAAASLIPGWLSQRFVEAPIRHSVELAARPRYALSLGANLSLATIAAGLAVALSWGSPTRSERESVNLRVVPGRVLVEPAFMGAAALGSAPLSSEAGKPQPAAVSITPDPAFADSDLPRAYAEGCQTAPPDSAPRWCQLGDPHGKKRVLMTGDSKMTQFFEPLDAVGKVLGWQITMATKGHCALSDAVSDWDNRPYPSCRQFNDLVRKAIEARPPDILVTSHSVRLGAPRDHLNILKPETMIAGLVKTWRWLRSLGTQVIVIADTPHPPMHRIAECVMKNPLRLDACAFDRAAGLAASATASLRAAAQEVPEVKLIDLNDFICPAPRCAPVIGNVLVYRQGAHVSNTYAKTLAPRLLEALQRLR
jgi:hypothetical protein